MINKLLSILGLLISFNGYALDFKYEKINIKGSNKYYIKLLTNNEENYNYLNYDYFCQHSKDGIEYGYGRFKKEGAFYIGEIGDKDNKYVQNFFPDETFRCDIIISNLFRKPHCSWTEYVSNKELQPCGTDIISHICINEIGYNNSRCK